MRRAWTAAILLLGTIPAAAQEDETAKALRALRDKVAPSVVAIEAVRSEDPEGSGGSGSAGAHDDYFNRPAGPSTGTVLTEDGLILTSSFNVSGELLRLTVITPDGRRHPAKRLGWDGRLDIALIRIEARDLKPLPRAKLEEARQGDIACVVGRAPDPSSPTLNLGILSALGRLNGTAVQTDAEVNYGNAGGPLVNLQGELIGVVSQVRPKASWGQSGGVGFATKMAEIDKILESLKKGQEGIAKKAKGPTIGIVAAEAPEGMQGVLVDQVLPGSPAEEAGLDSGDVITAIDGTPVTTLDGLRDELVKKGSGIDRRLAIRRKKRDGRTWETLNLKIRPVESRD